MVVDERPVGQVSEADDDDVGPVERDQTGTGECGTRSGFEEGEDEAEEVDCDQDWIGQTDI